MAREDKRRPILQAAEALFLSGRFDQVTLEQVRMKAGVGKGTIYRYFEGKEDLYAQVILSGLDNLNKLLEEKVRGVGSPEERLLAAAQALREFYGTRRNLFRSAHAEYLRGSLRNQDLHRELCERRQKTAEIIASIIGEARREGLFRTDVPARSAARMFLALMRAAAGAHGPQTGQRVPPDAVVSLFLDGIRRR